MRAWLDRLLDPGAAFAQRLQDDVVDPAARFVMKATDSFWPAMTAIAVAAILQATLPARVGQTRWIFAGLSLVLLVVVVFVNPRQIERRHKPLRGVMLVVVALLSIGNAITGAQLVIDLVRAEGINDAGTLLRTGGAIWLTNVIVFSLWYWLFDAGGPYARSPHGVTLPIAFFFPQMQADVPAPKDWRPAYVDYLYLAFTNAMAFSPTDVMPLKHWAKLTMLLQSLVSIMIAVLVVARAVNIL